MVAGQLHGQSDLPSVPTLTQPVFLSDSPCIGDVDHRFARKIITEARRSVRLR